MNRCRLLLSIACYLRAREPSSAILSYDYQSSEVHCHHFALWASRETKISHFSLIIALSLCHKNIQAFEVSMNDGGFHLVECEHALCDLRGKGYPLFPGERDCVGLFME